MTAVADPEIYAQILANMRDGVLTLDLAGRVITFNPAAGRLLGVAPETAAGQSFAELFCADPAFEQLGELVLQAIYEPSVTHSREIDLALPSGRARSSSTPRCWPAGARPAA
jgi:PAS domain S-box-containing protein